DRQRPRGDRRAAARRGIPPLRPFVRPLDPGRDRSPGPLPARSGAARRPARPAAGGLVMRRRIWFLLALATAACAEEVIPSFGDLQTPVALAVHQPSGRVLVASQDADELRVFDLESREYLAAPAVSFPLSIPTVPSPRLLVAGERFAFVVSGADGAVGFVDAVVPPGAFGPRSGDDDEGRPVAVFGGLLPTAARSLVRPHHYAEGLGDHALVGGLSLDGTGSRIVVVRPPFEGVEPEVVAELDLPGIGLAGLALEPAFEGDVPDCRAVAIADLGGPGGEGGGIHLGRVRVEADGSVRSKST